MPCATEKLFFYSFFSFLIYNIEEKGLPLCVVRRGQHTHCSALKCYNYPGEHFWVHSVCVITLRNRQLQTQALMEISLMGCLFTAGYGMSTSRTGGVSNAVIRAVSS